MRDLKSKAFARAIKKLERLSWQRKTPLAAGLSKTYFTVG
jgi:hypothetical protein